MLTVELWEKMEEGEGESWEWAWGWEFLGMALGKKNGNVGLGGNINSEKMAMWDWVLGALLWKKNLGKKVGRFLERHWEAVNLAEVLVQVFG